LPKISPFSSPKIQWSGKAYFNSSIIASSAALSTSETKSLAALFSIVLHGFPQYCVSIALYEDKEATHAVVYDPFKEEMFTASKGQGAYLNEQRIRTTRISTRL
jgi:hypothetical protein